MFAAMLLLLLLIAHCSAESKQERAARNADDFERDRQEMIENHEKLKEEADKEIAKANKDLKDRSDKFDAEWKKSRKENAKKENTFWTSAVIAIFCVVGGILLIIILGVGAGVFMCTRASRAAPVYVGPPMYRAY